MRASPGQSCASVLTPPRIAWELARPVHSGWTLRIGISLGICPVPLVWQCIAVPMPGVQPLGHILLRIVANRGKRAGVFAPLNPPPGSSAPRVAAAGWT